MRRRAVTMDANRDFTRTTLIAIWTIAALALGLWSLLAWGGYALLSETAGWVSRLVDPWIGSAAWDPHVATVLSWSESLGAFAVWGVWAFGTVGLLLTCAFATLLYVRAQRALAELR